MAQSAAHISVRELTTVRRLFCVFCDRFRHKL